MNIYLVFLIAYRYFHAILYKKSARILVLCSCLSIAAATCAVLIVYSITTGFEQATLRTLQGINPDIIISSNNNYLAVDAIQEIIRNEFPAVQATSPYTLEQGIVKSPIVSIKPYPAFIKVIDPQQEMRTSALETFLLNATKKLLDVCTKEGFVVIGSEIAASLHLHVNDATEIIIALAQDEDNASLSLVKIPVRIGDIIKTGVEEIDASLVLMHHAWYTKHNTESGFTHIGIKIKENDHRQIQVSLQKRFGALYVAHWTELYPSILEALNLEHYAFVLIMVIIISIASITMIAILTLMINTKHTDIALLYMCGALPRHIKSIFVVLGLMITTIATFIGISMAYSITAIARAYPITLPDVYYTKTLPLTIPFDGAVLVYCFSVVLTIGSALLATYIINRSSIIDTLKQE